MVTRVLKKRADEVNNLVRLQPSLLDRLTDDEPDKTSETNEQRVLSKTRLRECVLRDLCWLMNTVSAESAQVMEDYPEVKRSSINFGMPALSGLRLAEIEWKALEKKIAGVILTFEPRILPTSLEISAIAQENLINQHNMLGFEIRCQMWAQPYPLDMLLRTNVDLESGELNIKDLTTGK